MYIPLISYFFSDTPEFINGLERVVLCLKRRRKKKERQYKENNTLEKEKSVQVPHWEQIAFDKVSKTADRTSLLKKIYYWSTFFNFCC